MFQIEPLAPPATIDSVENALFFSILAVIIIVAAAIIALYYTDVDERTKLAREIKNRKKNIQKSKSGHSSMEKGIPRRRISTRPPYRGNTRR